MPAPVPGPHEADAEALVSQVHAMNEEPQDELAAATPFIARAAGGALMACGLFEAVSGLQLWGFILLGWVQAVPFVLVAAGLAAMGTGFQSARGRAGAVVSGLVIAPMILFGSSLWAIFGLTRGFVSIFGLLVPAVALASIALLVLAIGPTRRATDARNRLAEQGLDLGI